MTDSGYPTVSAGGQTAQPTTGNTIISARKPAKKKPAKKKGLSLAARLADPGLRSKLPDSQLTPDLLAKRRTNQYNAAPAAPGSSYTNGSLDQLLEAFGRQKFGPAQAELDQRQKMIPAWFAEYRAKIAGAQGAQQEAARQQVQSLQVLAGQASADTGGFANDPVAQAAAAVRGAGVSNQAAIAQQLGSLQGTYLGNLGLNSFGLENGANQQLGRERQDLAQQRGDFRVTERGSILSDEASNALKAALTSSQIGAATTNAQTSKARAKESARHNKASEKIQANNPSKQKTQAELDYFDKHGYWPPTGPPKKPKGKSPYLAQAGQNSFKDTFDKAIAIAKKRKGLGEGRKDAGQLLLNGRGAQTVDHNGTKVKVPAVSSIPQDVLTAALDYVYDGHLSAATIRKLHKRGIKVNSLGVPTKPPSVSEQVSSAIQAVQGALPG